MSGHDAKRFYLGPSGRGGEPADATSCERTIGCVYDEVEFGVVQVGVLHTAVVIEAERAGPVTRQGWVDTRVKGRSIAFHAARWTATRVSVQSERTLRIEYRAGTAPVTSPTGALRPGSCI